MPKQGASSGFKYGTSGRRDRSSNHPVFDPGRNRRAVGLEAVLATPRQGQGRRAAAGPAAVSGRSCGTRAQERPWPGRGIVDRALRSQVMNAPLKPAHSPLRRQRRGARSALPGVRRSGRESARASAQVLRLCRSRHGAPCRDGPSRSRTNVPSTSLVGETIDGYSITRDDVENALRPVLAYVEALLDAPGAEYLPRTPRRLSDHRRRLRHCRPDRPHRRHGPRHRFQVRRRRARPRALSRRRRGRHQRAARCSTPRPRATRFPNSLPASTTSF